MLNGYILLNRSILDHHLVGIGKPVYFSTWIWMIMQARFNGSFIKINGYKIPLNRGQFSHSISFISKATGMSVQQVRLFIGKLEKEQMVIAENNKGQNVITICNYDDYQDFIKSNNKGVDTKRTNGQEDEIPDMFAPINFDEFWRLYPRKEKKKDAEILYNEKVMGSTSEEAILDGARVYSIVVKDREKKHILLPTTWLNNGRWTDEHQIDDQPESKHDVWIYRLKEWKKGFWDEDRWGFPPDHAQNQVPKKILIKFGHKKEQEKEQAKQQRGKGG